MSAIIGTAIRESRRGIGGGDEVMRGCVDQVGIASSRTKRTGAFVLTKIGFSLTTVRGFLFLEWSKVRKKCVRRWNVEDTGQESGMGMSSS